MEIVVFRRGDKRARDLLRPVLSEVAFGHVDRPENDLSVHRDIHLLNFTARNGEVTELSIF